MAEKDELRNLPAVDEVLKSPQGADWLSRYPRRFVLDAVRQTIAHRRALVMKGGKSGLTVEDMASDIEAALRHLTTYSLRKVINATGIVVHTNLGRSALSRKALDHIADVSSGYSTLEYDVTAGKRGKRYAHIRRLLKEVTGAEDGIAVNNNAAAVLLALTCLAKGREVIVSRGELVEIGGSFRVPDVMAQSGAILKEVGTTNKTHLWDYERAIGEETALILKVHQSNYRITGFTKDVPLEELAALGKQKGIPVMYDLGSGCLVDLKGYGIHDEPSVQEMVKSGADVLTFSGDKLLGGPQAGIIVGNKSIIDSLQGHPLLRAVRMDKLTLAALEATLMQYMDEDAAMKDIPTLRMLTEDVTSVGKRAKRIAGMIKREAGGAAVSVVRDVTYLGGGALPEHALESFAVALRPEGMTINALEERLRLGEPPVIGRISEDTLLLDARTVADSEVKSLASCVIAALRG